MLVEDLFLDGGGGLTFVWRFLTLLQDATFVEDMIEDPGCFLEGQSGRILLQV